MVSCAICAVCCQPVTPAAYDVQGHAIQAALQKGYYKQRQLAGNNSFWSQVEHAAWAASSSVEHTAKRHSLATYGGKLDVKQVMSMPRS